MSRKVALVCDWIQSIGGAEKFLQALYKIYKAPIYCLFYSESALDHMGISKEMVFPSFVQKLPKAESNYRNYFPLFPRAIESFDLSEYDLIISSSHAVAKGIKKRPHQLHICYCHTPVRYAWDLQDEYLSSLPTWKKNIARPFLRYLRNWDLRTIDRVDHFLANSQYIRSRIENNYRRKAKCIYPPIPTDLFYKAEKKQDFYVTVSRLVPYKKIDVIVKAFSKMSGRRLVVIGDGPEKEKLQRIAKPNVEILGRQSDEEVRNYLSQAKCFVFAADEDFGLSPLEAQASGTPVIALGRGGTAETVLDGETGIFFHEQTPEAIIDAVQRFEKLEAHFQTSKIQSWVEGFREKRFLDEMQSFVEDKWEKHQLTHA